MINFEKKAMFTLEVFPPKDSLGLASIYASMGRFQALKPDYISVTYGAAGSPVTNTTEIAADIKNKFGVESIAHLICMGSSKQNIDTALDALKAAGVQHILALRGDKREGATCADFVYATDLIRHINQRGGFEVCAACYPEGHTECDSLEKNWDVMKRKADLGVTHFISQLFFDNDDFYRMQDAMHARGIAVPAMAGIMPVTNKNQILRMISLSGAKLPPRLTKLLARFGENKEALASACLNYALEQISDLLANGVRGIHLYAMNNPRLAEEIHRAVKPMLEGINGGGNL